MKKVFLFSLMILGTSVFLYAAGLRIGATKAIKAKVKEVDAKIATEAEAEKKPGKAAPTVSGVAAAGAPIIGYACCVLLQIWTGEDV